MDAFFFGSALTDAFSVQFALAVWLVTERLSNPFFELPTTLTDLFLLDVLDADTADIVDEAALATIAPRYSWMGEPIRPSTRATKQSGAAAKATAAVAPASAQTPATQQPAATNVATADASNDQSENSSHHSDDSWRATDTDVHRAPSTEERARAKELVDLIDGVPPDLRLDGPEHRFVMQGKLSKQNPSGVWQSRHYLLFDDVLVWTKPNLIGKRSVFKGAVGVVGGELRQTPVGESLDTRLCFTVRGGMGAIPGIVDKGKVYALKAATPGEKMTWVNAVRPLIARPLRRSAATAPADATSSTSATPIVAAAPAAPPVQPSAPTAQPPPPAVVDEVPPPSAEDAAAMRGSSSRRLARPKSAMIREALDIDEGTFASAVAVPKPPLVTGPSIASMDVSRPPPLFIGGLGLGNHDTDSEPSNSNSPLPSKRDEELQSPTSKPPPPSGPPPKHVVEATLKQQSALSASPPPHDAAVDKPSSARRRHKRHAHKESAPSTPDVAATPEKLMSSSRRKKSRSNKKEVVTPVAKIAATPPSTAPPLKPSPPPTVRPLENEQDNGPPPPPPDSSFKIALRKSGNRADVSDLVAPPAAPLSPLVAAHALAADGDEESTTESNDDADNTDEEVVESDESEEVVESDDDDDDDDAADGNDSGNARAVWSALNEGSDRPAAIDAASIERILSPPATAPLTIEADTIDEWQAKMQAQVAAKRAARVAASAPPVPPAPPTPPPAEPPAPPPRADEAAALFADSEWSAARDAAVESMRVGASVVASAQLHTASRLMAAAVRLEVAASAGKSQAMKSKATRKAARLVRLARQLVAPINAAAAAVCDAKLATLGDAGDDGDDGERWCFETFEPLEVDEAYLQCDRCASVFSATSTDDRLAPERACVVCSSGKLAIVDGDDDDDDEESEE